MPGRGSIQRKRERRHAERTAKVLKHEEDGFATYKSLDMTADDVFAEVIKRVAQLNDKISWNRANGFPHGFYVRERESILWMMDKIRDLSAALLAQKKDTK